LSTEHNEKGPGAAATAHRAENVASQKPTGFDNGNPPHQQTANAEPLPDKTGVEQASDASLHSRPSLRSAIDAMCRNCIYDPEWGNGTWREQVEACSSANCPLHVVRPVTLKAQKASKEARRRSLACIGALAPLERPHGCGLDSNGLIPEQRRAA
jgi:hypothetical protein